MPQEFFDVVDENDNVVGSKPGIECVTRGLLHRAVAIFLFNSKSEVYLQRRSEKASWYPGYWSASCTGHVSAGESYLTAAEREVKEELGLHCGLTEIGKIVSPKWKYKERIEWEYITIFEGKVEDQVITLSDESEEGHFIPFQDFKKSIESGPDKFTPDTVLAFGCYSKAKMLIKK